MKPTENKQYPLLMTEYILEVKGQGHSRR